MDTQLGRSVHFLKILQWSLSRCLLKPTKMELFQLMGRLKMSICQVTGLANKICRTKVLLSPKHQFLGNWEKTKLQ